MTIDRTAGQEETATMTLFFTNPSAPHTSASSTGSAAPTTDSKGKHPDHQPFERTETISMSYTTPEAILQQLVSITKAVEVPLDPEDQRELERLEEARQRATKDRAVTMAVNKAKIDEERLLAQARGQLLENQ